MKGKIKAPHASTNKYTFAIVGLPPITAVKVGGLDDETVKTELPDRTAASSGESGPSELTVAIPAHHAVEIAAMEIWLREGRDPVSPTYKKTGTVMYQTITGQVAFALTLLGVWVTKRNTPEQDMKSDGDLTVVEYTLSVDQTVPI